MQGLRGSCPPQENITKKSVDETIILSKYEFHWISQTLWANKTSHRHQTCPFHCCWNILGRFLFVVGQKKKRFMKAQMLNVYGLLTYVHLGSFGGVNVGK